MRSTTSTTQPAQSASRTAAPALAVMSPLIAHRLAFHLSEGHGIAAHLLPHLMMLVVALIAWRFVPPMPGEGASQRPRQLGLVLAAGILFGAFAAAANLLVMLASSDEAAQGTIGLRVAAVVLQVTLLSPLAEEFAFRGLLYRGLRQAFRPLVAALVSAAVFALMHGSFGQTLWAFLLGGLLAFLYEQTRSLAAPVVAHALFNAVPVGVAVIRSRPTDFSPIWLAIALLSVVFALAARSATEALGRHH